MQSIPISQEALFNELRKIASEVETQPKKSRSLVPALKAMAVGTAGGAVGYGLHEMLARKLPPETMARASKVIVPILAGAATMLAERYRSSMNKQYSKVRGYGDKGQK